MSALLCLAGCKGRVEESDSPEKETEEVSLTEEASLTGEDLKFHERKKDIVEEVLETQVDSLANEPWNKDEYQRLAKWIESDDLDITYTARTSFASLLDANYCISMDNEARTLLTTKCGKSHSQQEKRLDAIMKERANFKPERTSIGQKVRTAYDNHRSMIAIVNSFYAKQAVKSYLDKYDESYESKKKAEAKTAYNTYHPACTYLEENLTNPKFASRRINYCEQILSLFEKHVHDTGDLKDFNLVDGSLYNVYGYSDGKQLNLWRARMDALKESVKEVSENN